MNASREYSTDDIRLIWEMGVMMQASREYVTDLGMVRRYEPALAAALADAHDAATRIVEGGCAGRGTRACWAMVQLALACEEAVAALARPSNGTPR